MKDGARQMMTVNMKGGSSFLYIPHPLVPHEKSIFLSRNKILMEENCSLIWGEVISCGRKMNGEVFRFSSYHNITEIFFKKKLVIKENILIKPSEINVKAIGQLEGFTHQASLLCVDSNIDTEVKKEIVANRLLSEENIAFGVSSVALNGLIVRLLGYKSEQLFDLLKNISIILSEKELKKNIHVA
jgi:urease accessory protein